VTGIRSGIYKSLAGTSLGKAFFDMDSAFAIGALAVTW